MKCPRDHCEGSLGLDRETNELVCSACERRFDPSIANLPEKTKETKPKPTQVTPTVPVATVETPESTPTTPEPETEEEKTTTGGNMAGVNVDELKPETLEKLGAEVPPRPDTTGMTKGSRIHALAKYYEDNKEAILSDIDTIGEKAAILKWGMSTNGWLYRRAKWFPEKYDLPPWQTPEHKAERKRIKKAQELTGEPVKSTKDKKPPAPDKKTPSPDFDPVNNAHLEVQLSYYMGYHRCVQDFLQAGVIR